MAKAKRWVDSGGILSYDAIPGVYDNLPSNVYELNFDKFKEKFFLDRLFEKFELPEKIYDLETDLIDRAINTFSKYDKNFGILLKGLKGTGKTIVAKLISNKLNLPVILVNSAYANMGNFINSIDQDIIVIFDEFEKMYNFYSYQDDDEDLSNISNLLTLMDGVFTSKNKRLFILTTNKEYLPDAMMARPSRIRYIKDFSDMSKETVMYILNDLVENKELIPKIVEIVEKLEVISVDIIKSMAEEANLYNKADEDFFSIFNISKLKYSYTIFKKVNKKEEIIARGIEEKNFAPNRYVNDLFDNYYGSIIGINKDEHKIIINTRDGKTQDLWYREEEQKHAIYRI